MTHDPVESQSLKEKMHNPALQSLLRAYFGSLVLPFISDFR